MGNRFRLRRVTIRGRKRTRQWFHLSTWTSSLKRPQHSSASIQVSSSLSARCESGLLKPPSHGLFSLLLQKYQLQRCVWVRYAPLPSNNLRRDREALGCDRRGGPPTNLDFHIWRCILERQICRGTQSCL